MVPLGAHLAHPLPITEVDDFAENVLEQHISQIDGVGQVQVAGQQKPSVRIQLDPVKVASPSACRSRIFSPA